MIKLTKKIIIVSVLSTLVLLGGLAYWQAHYKKANNFKQNNFILEKDPHLSDADRKVFEDQITKLQANLTGAKDDSERYGLYVLLGSNEYGLGHLQAAADYFNQAIKISSKEYGVYTSLSQIQIDMNDNQGALASLQKALDINSGNADTWRRLIQLKIDRFNATSNELKKLFTQALDDTRALPTYIDVLTFYASWLEKIGDLPGAVDYWGQAILANPAKKAVYQGEINRLKKLIKP